MNFTKKTILFISTNYIGFLIFKYNYNLNKKNFSLYYYL